MKLRLFAVMLLTGCLIAPALADKQKAEHATATAPKPIGQPACVHCDRHLAPTLTPPLEKCLEAHKPHGVAAEPAFPLPRDLTMQDTAGAATAADVQVVKTYSVADLVVPLPVAGMPPSPEHAKTLEARLIRQIMAHVEPPSWSNRGGIGTIEYYPIGMALVVNHTPRVHAAIDKYLDALRRMQDEQITCEVLLVTVSDEWFEKSGLRQAILKDTAADKSARPEPRVLSAAGKQRLLKLVQEDGTANVLQAPRITCLNGQAGRIRVCDTEYYMTGFSVQSVDGMLVYTPKNEAHELGVALTVSPTIAADGKHVQLGIEGGLRELAVRPVAKTPIIAQVRADVAQAAAVQPLAQYIQEPKVAARSVDCSLTLASGCTTLVYAGKATLQETKADGRGNERTESRCNHLLMLVSADVVASENLQDVGQANPQLTKMLAEYQSACAAGKADDARRLAIECLALDPTCFGKSR